MKIKNANEVKVGDVMVLGGLAWHVIDVDDVPGDFGRITFEPHGRSEKRLLRIEVQDLIDHGFEVTRKVEPVVLPCETITSCPYCTKTDPPLVITLPYNTPFKAGDSVRATLEPID